MPGICGKALDAALDLASDILNLKVGEEMIINFKDEPMTIKRIK